MSLAIYQTAKILPELITNRFCFASFTIQEGCSVRTCIYVKYQPGPIFEEYQLDTYSLIYIKMASLMHCASVSRDA